MSEIQNNKEIDLVEFAKFNELEGPAFEALRAELQGGAELPQPKVSDDMAKIMISARRELFGFFDYLSAEPLEEGAASVGTPGEPEYKETPPSLLQIYLLDERFVTDETRGQEDYSARVAELIDDIHDLYCSQCEGADLSRPTVAETIQHACLLFDSKQVTNDFELREELQKDTENPRFAQPSASEGSGAGDDSPATDASVPSVPVPGEGGTLAKPEDVAPKVDIGAIELAKANVSQEYVNELALRPNMTEATAIELVEFSGDRKVPVPALADLVVRGHDPETVMAVVDVREELGLKIPEFLDPKREATRTVKDEMALAPEMAEAGTVAEFAEFFGITTDGGGMDVAIGLMEDISRTVNALRGTIETARGVEHASVEVYLKEAMKIAREMRTRDLDQVLSDNEREDGLDDEPDEDNE